MCVKYILLKSKPAMSVAVLAEQRDILQLLRDRQKEQHINVSVKLHALTSAGTLNFSTTPSSKNMRMPALMRSVSETGRSLKENRYRFSPVTLSAGGQFAL